MLPQPPLARGLVRRPHKVPRVMGIDEKALAKGQRYATLACDLDAGHVIGIAEGRYRDCSLRNVSWVCGAGSQP